MNTKSQALEWIKSEGALLAIVPILATFITIVFEMGYLAFYDVPFAVIDINLYRIGATVAWISIYFAFAWFFIARLMAAHASKSKSLQIFWTGLVCAPFVIPLLMDLEYKREELAYLSAPAFILIVWGLTWLLKKDGPLKIKYSDEVVESFNKGVETEKKAQEISGKYNGPFLIIGMLLFVVWIMGYWSAKLLDHNGWVLADSPSFLLVRHYGNSYVFKQIDPVKMELKKNIRVITLGDNSVVDLTPINISKLKGNFPTLADIKKNKLPENTDPEIELKIPPKIASP